MFRDSLGRSVLSLGRSELKALLAGGGVFVMKVLNLQSQALLKDPKSGMQLVLVDAYVRKGLLCF